MKKILAAILSLCIIGGVVPQVCSDVPECAVTASAADYKTTDKGLKYEVKDGKISIVGYTDKLPAKLEIPAKIDGMSVTSIEDKAFFRCFGLTEITIPDSVTNIGDTAFQDCKSLTGITIPDSVTSIAYGTFTNCIALTEITIPDSVKSIGEVAFAHCTSLREITIPDNVTSIKSDTFSYCTSLRKITIPDSVKSIGEGAFAHCTSLGEITIPNSVTSIGKWAFYDCTCLTEITFSNSLKSIAYDALCDTPWFDAKRKENPLVVVNGILIDGQTCSGIVTLPDNVTSIGEGAFAHCASLTEITIPDSVTSIGDRAFFGCDSLTEIAIPDSVTSIGNGAFYWCNSLTEITIPDSMTCIEEDVFAYCAGLTEITIPDSVTSIGSGAFYNCHSLTEITIPNSVTSMGSSVFGFCFDLTIKGYTGSNAETYAENNNLMFRAIDNPDRVIYPKTTRGFVTRMYNVVLHRDPDSAGLKNWVTKLNSGTATAADIINGFFLSNEYQNKKQTADELIEDCYKAILDRSSDASGKANWKNRLSVGMSIQSICKGFVGSSEFKELCSYYDITPGNITPKYARDESYERTNFIYRLYKNCLGRNPSISEVENWCKQIKAGKTGSSIAYGFIFSKEYKGKNVSNSQFVDMLYRTILGRSGDSNGIKSWMAKLDANAARESVFNGFLFSTEFKKQCDKAGIKVSQ